MRAVYFPQFPNVPLGVVIDSHIVYSQRHINEKVIDPTLFHVFLRQLHITSFIVEAQMPLSFSYDSGACYR